MEDANQHPPLLLTPICAKLSDFDRMGQFEADSALRRQNDFLVAGVCRACRACSSAGQSANGGALPPAGQRANQSSGPGASPDESG